MSSPTTLVRAMSVLSSGRSLAVSDVSTGQTGEPLWSDELGSTYRARQEDPEREVALLLLNLTQPDRQARRQFRSSCLAAADLNGHPGVLALYTVDFTA